jgi:hypothetical protein
VVQSWQSERESQFETGVRDGEYLEIELRCRAKRELNELKHWKQELRNEKIVETAPESTFVVIDDVFFRSTLALMDELLCALTDVEGKLGGDSPVITPLIK